MAFNFEDKIGGDSGTALIVDALNLAFRWKHQGRTDFRHDYVAVVKSLATSYNCGNIIITADWGSSSYRKEILPEYKQNRKDKYATQTEEEKQAFIDFFEEYEETLELLAEEYKEKEISFNVLALGAVQTEMLTEAFPDYQASLQANEMANYIYNFAISGNRFYNGKVLQVSNTTP